jgi:hypothetical protein
MTPTSPLAGLLTGLVDGLVIAVVVMLVVMLNSRRHRLAEARLRSATLPEPRPDEAVSRDRFDRA